jgi:hypothetical protein
MILFLLELFFAKNRFSGSVSGVWTFDELLTTQSKKALALVNVQLDIHVLQQ